MIGELALVRLLQLASPTLPVGAYSYSQGLEAAIDGGVVRDTASAAAWIGAVLRCAVARMEAPVFLRLHAAWGVADARAVQHWNDLFLASRETAELHAETVQMGFSAARLLSDMGGFDALCSLERPAFPAVFSLAAVHWRIAAAPALLAYLWAWTENQVMAAVKAVPLGQTDGQRMLHALGGRLPDLVRQAGEIDDDDLGGFAPGLALWSSRHETQYTRLFRS